jgi:hypothetical protein
VAFESCGGCTTTNSRFYCRPHLADIARGRDDIAVDHYDRDDSSWRSKTIEPIVHEAMSRPGPPR